jgi:hypothetical protein
MSREAVLRTALWVAAACNLVGAVLFGFPQSWLGRFVSFPGDVPPTYRAFAALFVLLFGAAYAYMAGQAVINRGLVAFGAIGKAGAFATMVALYLFGEAAGAAVVLFSADLLLAGVFFWTLHDPDADRRDGVGARTREG